MEVEDNDEGEEGGRSGDADGEGKVRVM